jgi:glyoxylase-like metal-dependent hydrolase (beta-lactamase superfamily II)
VPSVKVGNAEITSLLDLAFAFPYSAAYPGVSEEQWAPYKAIYPKSWTDQGLWATNAQAFLIRSGGQNVLVDTGLGPTPAFGGGPGRLLESMRAAGVNAADIDVVVMTHLHVDHTGWIAPDGSPTFTNARHIVPEEDFANLGNTAAMFAEKAPFEAVQSAGKLELSSGEKSVGPELTLIPTPGHTPGHRSLLIVSAGERGIILGDLFNHPAQVNETTWNAGFDFDPPTAVATRTRVFERLEQDGSLVASGHYPQPGFGHIVRADGRRIFRAL